MTKKDKELLLNCGGMFHKYSRLEESKKLKIIKWYNSLDKRTKDMVDVLIAEASRQGYYECEDEHSDDYQNGYDQGYDTAISEGNISW